MYGSRMRSGSGVRFANAFGLGFANVNAFAFGFVVRSQV